MKRFLSLLSFELYNLFRDPANILILYIAAIFYAFLYGYLYSPQTVTDMPIAVVDMDETALSHQMIQAFHNTSYVNVQVREKSLDNAKNCLMERKVFGVIYIPQDFETNSLSGRQSHIGVYADGSYFLHYAALTKAASTVTNSFSKKIQTGILVAKGQSEHTAEVISSPVNFQVETLYNPTGAYATGLMPGVFVMIIQQTLLLVIAMIIGTQNEFKLWSRYNNDSTISILFSKIVAYSLAAVPSIVFLFWIAYKIFDYPMLESTMDLIALFIPFVLCVVCLGIALGGLFNRREASVLYIAPLSIFFILWSGISWPQESMPSWFYLSSLMLPSTSAIRGVVSLRTCGADMFDIYRYYLVLWALTTVYFILAFYSLRMCRRRSLE